MSLDWLATVGAGAAGGVVTLSGDLLLRRLTKGDTRRSRAEQRSEAAAEEIMRILREAERRFAKHRDYQDDLPGYDEVRDLVEPLEDATLVVMNEEVRRRLSIAAEALSHLVTLAHWGQGSPRKVTWSLRRVGADTLGAMLREEPLPSDTSPLESYQATIDEERQAFEENMRQQKERRAAEREAKRQESSSS